MYTNIEFLDTEPIENVITAMHFRMDKTIFIGYEDVIEEYRQQTEAFLKKHCGVKFVDFVAVSKTDLDEVITAISEEVKKEKAAGNQVFFDITGGEGLILVAFGMLAKEHQLPMHQYEVETDKLYELNPEEAKSIRTFDEICREKINLDLRRYIEMFGAVVKPKKEYEILNMQDADFCTKIEKVWEVVRKYRNSWNFYSGVLNSRLRAEEMFATAVLNDKTVRGSSKFIDFLQELEAAGAILEFQHTVLSRTKDGNPDEVKYTFSYESHDMKNCLYKGGTVLELFVYMEMKKNATDCEQSVSIDWDGVVHRAWGIDVLNEIDVLAIHGNIPVFISCKSGKMSEGEALHPLYELHTVASRFGGKYARKVLATLQELEGVYAERAKELGIEVQCY